ALLEIAEAEAPGRGREDQHLAQHHEQHGERQQPRGEAAEQARHARAGGHGCCPPEPRRRRGAEGAEEESDAEERRYLPLNADGFPRALAACAARRRLSAFICGFISPLRLCASAVNFTSRTGAGSGRGAAFAY